MAGSLWQWRVTQKKGDEGELGEDAISCMKFSHSGQLLAVGDKGGHVSVLRRQLLSDDVEYRTYTRFQSHVPEFDCLQSTEIGERIVDVQWVRQTAASSHFLLSTNSYPVTTSEEKPPLPALQSTDSNQLSTYHVTQAENGNKHNLIIIRCKAFSQWLLPSKLIGKPQSGFSPNQIPAEQSMAEGTKVVKLWKVAERCKELNGSNLEDETGQPRDPQSVTSLQLPVLKTVTTYVEASPRRIYNNVHAFFVNSLSVNSDQETFLSADDLRINIWHLDFTNKHFTVVDLKPALLDDLEEVITSAEFHPTECNLFVYSSSKGALRLCDMRSQALCDRNGKLFSAQAGEKHILSEVISSASDVKFSHGGQYLMSRDFLTIKVWDVRMETQPVEVHQVHPYLRSKLYNLYESECLYDRFESNWSSDDRHILTGTYNDFFRLFDRDNRKDVTLGVSKSNFKSQQLLRPKKVFLFGPKNRKDEINVDAIDTGKKILCTSWHPSENIIALASSNNVYLLEGSEL